MSDKAERLQLKRQYSRAEENFQNECDNLFEQESVPAELIALGRNSGWNRLLREQGELHDGILHVSRATMLECMDYELQAMITLIRAADDPQASINDIMINVGKELGLMPDKEGSISSGIEWSPSDGAIEDLKSLYRIVRMFRNLHHGSLDMGDVNQNPYRDLKQALADMDEEFTRTMDTTQADEWKWSQLGDEIELSGARAKVQHASRNDTVSTMGSVTRELTGAIEYSGFDMAARLKLYREILSETRAEIKDRLNHRLNKLCDISDKARSIGLR